MRFATILFLSLVLFAGGCGMDKLSFDYFKGAGMEYDGDMKIGYDVIQLKISSAADAFAAMVKTNSELLSQSKNVVAEVGHDKDGRMHWFTMVSFDENSLTAQRKYFFLVDEEPKVIAWTAKKMMFFETEMAVSGDVLDAVYTAESARRIAILEVVKTTLARDVDEVSPDNKKFSICGMLLNQTLEGIIRNLEQSPALTQKIDVEKGIEFDHPTLGGGRVYMEVIGDVVMVKIRIGSLNFSFDQPAKPEKTEKTK